MTWKYIPFDVQYGLVYENEPAQQMY